MKIQLLILGCSFFLASQVQAQNRFNVGTGIGCTHATIQAAINAAGADGGMDSTIAVSRTLTYTTQALTINNQNLTIIGGLASCNESAPAAGFRTNIDGAGGSATSVISARGTGNLTLLNLNISGGDEGDSYFGGGVDYAAIGTIFLDNVDLHHNKAGYGAGVSIDGSRAFAVFGANVLVYDNIAQHEGGGAYCRNGRLSVKVGGSGLFNNRAWSEGGGVRLYNCDAGFSATGPLGAGVIFGNLSDGNGGGISASDSTVDLYTINPTSPGKISTNKAGGRGGAMALYDTSWLRAFDAVLENNKAFEGGAIYVLERNVHEYVSVDMTKSSDPLLTFRPSDAVSCDPSITCNRITGNIATGMSTTVAKGIGAAMSFVSTADKWDCCDFIPQGRTSIADWRNVQMDRNAGDSLVRINNYDIPRDLGISGCLIHSNTLAGDMFVDTAQKGLYLTHCTVANNTIGGAVIRGNNVVELICSIVDQPANAVIVGASSMSQRRVQNVLVPNTSGLPSNTTIASGRPIFVNATAGNFRLFQGDRFSPASPGLDFAADCGSLALTRDLDNRTRPVDLNSRPNQFGAIDLGAFEQRPETIFLPGTFN
jgi:hypothetical protein